MKAIQVTIFALCVMVVPTNACVRNALDIPEDFVFGERCEESIRVSIFELIVRPEKFIGRRVCVAGIIAVGEDGPGFLFPDVVGLRDDANQINLGASEALFDQRAKFSGRRVVICGPFSAVIRKDGEIAHRGIHVEHLVMSGKINTTPRSER